MTLTIHLNDIADRLERLAPSHRDPFRFHEEKSELVDELRRLATSPRFWGSSANDNTTSVVKKYQA
ncbi:hypothetical protein ABK249_14490 [Neorhizobium sp. Rsf11]|uniref:Uncharacterized protein n=1 Tax=Neorhizobium phenanthreniclasticum TaxID=3157917 RepID=A0ABV0M3X3_9HYPH